jgi:DNA-binding transcriptional LysR family regulator
MSLTSRPLAAFLAVAEQGSLGRAAAALNVTQPALSRIIRRLEADLGAPLFERHSTGMLPTSFGQALLPYAQLIQAEAGNAEREIAALRGLDRGLVRVGAIGSAAMMLLPDAIDRMLRRWPGLRVRLVEAVEDQLAQALIHNEIDIAIAGELEETDDIVRVAAQEFADRCDVIAAVGHPLQQASPLDPRQLLEHPWVMPPKEATPRRQFTRLMQGIGFEPPAATVETRSIGVIMTLVAGHGFLGWMPQPLYASAEVAGLVRPLPLPALSLRRRFHLYRRRRGILPPPALRLIEALAPSN